MLSVTLANDGGLVSCACHRVGKRNRVLDMKMVTQTNYFGHQRPQYVLEKSLQGIRATE